MNRKYWNLIYIDRDPTDPYKGWGWVEVGLEDIKRFQIPTTYPETYKTLCKSNNRFDYPNSGNLPSRGKAGTKKFTLNLDGELVTVRAQKSLTIQAVCTWIRTWASPDAKIITPGNRTLTLAGEKLTHQTHFVYFILNEDSQAVKVGHAKDLAKRLKSLQTSSPVQLKILKSIQVDNSVRAKALEKEIHQKFAAIRLSGEWFKAEAHLLQYIDQLA